MKESEIKKAIKVTTHPTGDIHADIGKFECEGKPAEVFSVGQHLQDEMDARGWSLEDLLNRMPGDRNQNQLWVEIVLAAHEFDHDIRKDLRLGDASALAHAFGTSKEFWENLDAAWVEHENSGSSRR